MNEILNRLLKVKSLVTLVLTLTFAYLAVTGTITADQVLTIYATIIAFYFGVQATKNKD